MLSKSVKIAWKDDNDARPVAMLVNIAGKFSSSVLIGTPERKINAKSIMGMMTMKLFDGEDVTVETDGVDEDDAMTEIEGFLRGN